MHHFGDDSSTGFPCAPGPPLTLAQDYGNDNNSHAQLIPTGMIGRPGSRLRLNDVTVIDCISSQPHCDRQDQVGDASANLFVNDATPTFVNRTLDDPFDEVLLYRFGIARGLRKAKQMSLSCPQYLRPTKFGWPVVWDEGNAYFFGDRDDKCFWLCGRATDDYVCVPRDQALEHIAAANADDYCHLGDDNLLPHGKQHINVAQVRDHDPLAVANALRNRAPVQCSALKSRKLSTTIPTAI